MSHLIYIYTVSPLVFEFLILNTVNTLEGDVSDVTALDQLTLPFSPQKATRMLH